MKRGLRPRARGGVVAFLIPSMLLPLATAAEIAAAGTAEASARLSSPRASFADTSELLVSWHAVEAAVGRHPSLSEARYERSAASASVDAAGAVPNPNLEVSSGYGRARDGSASRVEWGASIHIPLGWLAQRRARMGAAEAEVDAVAAEAESLRQQLVVELHGMFWGLVHAQEKVAALAKLREEALTLAKTVRRRVQAGESRPVEAARVEVEEERVIAELAVAEAEEQARQEQLSLWLGTPSNRRLRAVADLEDVPRPPTAIRVQRWVRERHPSVTAASARLRALEAAAAAERQKKVPEFALGIFTDHELDRSSYGATLSVDLPFWDRNTGGIRHAEAELAAGRKRVEAQRFSVQSAAIELRASCVSSVVLADRYRDRMEPRAAEAMRVIQRSYEIGESSLLEVLDARRTYLETRTESLDALVRAKRDCSRLAVLLGERLP